MFINMKLNASQIKRVKGLGISVIYLFGSYAEGKDLPLSDIDIGVVFTDESALSNSLGETYNELYDIFTDIFHGKNIDIVFLQKAGLELRFDVISHGKVLYESSSAERLRFDEKTMLLYADFKPLLKEFNEVILNRA